MTLRAQIEYVAPAERPIRAESRRRHAAIRGRRLAKIYATWYGSASPGTVANDVIVDVLHWLVSEGFNAETALLRAAARHGEESR